MKKKSLSVLLTSLFVNSALAQTCTSTITDEVSGNIIGTGQTECVESNGITNGSVINNDGRQNVQSGGTSNDSVINGGGVQNVGLGGTSNDSVINYDGWQYVYGTSNDSVINNDGQQIVNSGGTSYDSVINYDGGQYVYGISDGSVINGGRQYVFSDGTSYGSVINNDGWQYVSGTSNDSVINNDGRQDINSGGTSNGSVINSGGVQYVNSGGTSYGSVINSGGVQHVTGTSNGSVINGGGRQTVQSGGTSNDSVINNDGRQYVYTGGTSYDSVIHNGGQQDVFGTANGSVINGGVQNVYTGGTSYGSEVNSGGQQHVYTGGTSHGSVIHNGGQQDVYTGGTSYGSEVNSGGQQHVYTGGTSHGSVIHNGGQQDVFGTANGSVINGGVQNVYTGGTSYGSEVNSGGQQHVYSGGIANNVTVNDGDLRLIGGQISGGIIEKSGTLTLDTTNITSKIAGIINDKVTVKGIIVASNTDSLTLNKTANLIFEQDTLNFDTTTIDFTLIGQGGLTQKGNNKLILNNTNTYTGETIVNNGFLYIGDSSHTTANITSNVTVNDGGTLGGFGSINGDVTVSYGGRLSVGSESGNLTVSGHNVTFNAGASFLVNITPSEGGILSADTVTINNANLNVLFSQQTFQDNDYSYKIIAANDVIGTFSTHDASLAFFDHNLVYTPDSVVLNLVRNSQNLADIASTPNEKNVSSALNNLGQHNIIYQNILALSAEDARKAYNSLSGEIHASAKGAMLVNTQNSRNSIYNHLNNTKIQNSDAKRDLWFDLWGHTGHLKSNSSGATKLKNEGFGLLIGSDIYSNDTIRFGAALGYEENQLHADARHSKADTKAFQMMAYGQVLMGNIDLSGGIGYALQKVDVKRTVMVNLLNSYNQSKYDANIFQLFLKGKYNFAITDDLMLSPYTSLAYQNLKTKSKRESGEISNLFIHGKNDHLVTTSLGLEYNFKINDLSNVYADISWQHNFKNIYDSNMSISNQNFTVRGASIDKNSARLRIGANLNLAPSSKLNFGYDGSFGSGNSQNSLRLQYSYSF